MRAMAHNRFLRFRRNRFGRRVTPAGSCVVVMVRLSIEEFCRLHIPRIWLECSPRNRGGSLARGDGVVLCALRITLISGSGYGKEIASGAAAFEKAGRGSRHARAQTGKGIHRRFEFCGAVYGSPCSRSRFSKT